MSDKLISKLESIRKSDNLDLVIYVGQKDKTPRTDKQGICKGDVVHYINLAGD